MKVAFVFPGQGSQKPGMGRSLHDSVAAARAVWEQAESVLGRDLRLLAFEGPEEDLKATRNAQLALYVSECAALAALNDAGVAADFAAGHSIGEYAALVCARVLSFEQGLRLVQTRAAEMDKAAQANPGAMAAILGLDTDSVEKAVQAGSQAGSVQVANYNSPGQIVISGDAAGVDAASKAAQELGARRVMPLAVSGAFHSKFMQQAADALGQALAGADLQNPAIPVILNVTALPATGAEQIRTLLADQVTSPVRWHESVEYLMGQGCGAIIEVGPGQVLSGLARRMDNAPETVSVDDPAGIEQARALKA